jgi:trigger factor
VLPEIERAIVGQKAPAEVTVEVQMPEGAQHPKLKGKKADFQIQIKEIKTRVLPDLDDEFAKDLGDFEDLSALRKSIFEQLEARASEEADNAVAKALVAELVRANPIEVPPTLVQQQMRITEQELLRQGGGQRQLPPELRQRVLEDSEIKVRAGLLMAEIAKSNGIQVESSDMEEGLKSLAEQTGKNVARLKAEYASKQKREMLVGMILENKVLDIIEQAAKIEQE